MSASVTRGAKVFVVSGPSGSGKSTIVSRLKQLPGVFYSVSVTSRPPRPGERDGLDYYFVSSQRFREMIAASEFAEWAEVAANLYGTPNGPIVEALAEGRDVLLDLDVQGAMQMKRKFPAAVLVFLDPPSVEVLEKRLRSRGTETEEAIRRRLDLAKREMEYAPGYDYRVINDDLEEAVGTVERIMRD